MKQLLLSVFYLLLLAPIVLASSDEDDDSFFEFPDLDEVVVQPILDGISDFFNGLITDLFSMPINPLLEWFVSLLTHTPDFSNLHELWNLVRYIISIFYGLLLLFAGFKFLISGSDPVAREDAKSTLKNVVIMVILVQASFLLYGWIAEIGSGLSSGVISMLPSNYFTLQGSYDVGLTFTYAGFILLNSLTAVMIAGTQILLIYLGLLIFPLGIFLYYFGTTKSFGKLLLNLSIGILFIGFFQALVLLIASGIQSLGAVNNHDLALFIGLCAYNNLTILLVLFLLFKGAFGVMDNSAGRIAKVIAV